MRYSAGGSGSDCRSPSTHSAAISACSSTYWMTRETCFCRRRRPGKIEFTATSFIAGSADGDSGDHALLVAEDRDHHDFGVGKALPRLADQIDAVTIR